MTTPILFIYAVYATALAAALARGGLRSVTKIPAVNSGGPFTRVLIIGATGGTGRQLLTQALERGLMVTALVRRPQALTVQHPRLTVVQGDVLDYSTVENAVCGQDAVLSALGHKRFFVPSRILSEGTRNVLRAMETHGVRRFVCETSLGLGNSVGRMGLYYSLFVIPFILPLYFWDKTRQEQSIAASKLEWVIVRPAALTNSPARGIYRHGFNVGSFVWTARISRADVAHFMLNQLTDNSYLGTAVGVSN
ncbi:MAG TPA: SDR family oxidoreductase [Candidatus Dormibacteraeota bacterium]|nr:SDR family oxidoreductase [Candidatus Dormibacteraeota bacterium]